MDIREVFAKNVRAYRNKAGLSQEKLGQRCGLHRTYIGGIEQMKRNASLKNVGKIADALGVSPMLLFIELDGNGRPLFATTPLVSGERLPEEEAVLSDCAIAICNNGVLEFLPITADETDLSTQILSNLIQLGYSDSKLLEKYNEIWPEIKRLYGINPSL